MKKRFMLLLPGVMFIFLATSCATYTFGVKDKAEQVPSEFAQTEAAIAQAEQSPGAKYCPEKIVQAKELGRKAIDAYWLCLNDEASRLLAQANQLAADARKCGPAPVPQPVKLPPPPVKPAPLPEKVCITLNIEFDFDRADIKPKYHTVIEKVADFMKKYPETTAVIEGHTDSKGAYAYNMKLSERRAEAVMKYLIDKFGIAADRLSTKGYGYTKPKDTNKTAAGRQKNRRIEAMIDCVVYSTK